MKQARYPLNDFVTALQTTPNRLRFLIDAGYLGKRPGGGHRGKERTLTRGEGCLLAVLLQLQSLGVRSGTAWRLVKPFANEVRNGADVLELYCRDGLLLKAELHFVHHRLTAAGIV